MSCKLKSHRANGRCELVDLLEGRVHLSTTSASAVVVPAALTTNSASTSAATLAPVVTYDSTGVTKLSYNGVTLFDKTTDPSGQLAPVQLTLMSAQGAPVETWISAHDYSTSWNAASHQLTWTFLWGTVTNTFTQTGNALNMATTIHNTSTSLTVGGVGMMWSLHFPTLPTGLSTSGPTVTFGANDPAVVTAGFTGGTLAVVNTDATNLYSGFWSSIGSTSTVSPLWISSGGTLFPAPGWPVIHRTVAPGSSDTFHIALRFGPAGSTAQQLAPDAYSNALAQNPYTVNWPDRRPIGYDIPAGSSDAGRSATNPNGWFNDSTVNVKTKAGLAAFSTRLLAYADASVTELKTMNAQGVIMWDMEGERFPQPTSYVGDPRIATQLAPELTYNNLIGQYFKKFTDSGLRVGMTIRPTQFTLNGSTASQVSVDNTAQLLINKINYARSHWGCTLFYIDSDQGGRLENLQDVFKTVAAAEPGVLLIPEHTTTLDYASTAPLQLGAVPTTPASAIATYPDTFSVISAVGLNFDAATQASLTASVARGDILLFHGWYAEAANTIISQIYQTGAAERAAATASVMHAQLARSASSTLSATTATTSEVPSDLQPDGTQGIAAPPKAGHHKHAVFSNRELVEATTIAKHATRTRAA